MADSRKLIVEVIAKDQAYTSGINRAKKTTQGFNSELAKGTRGALAGSGAFKSLGRSLAFASGGFLAIASVSGLIRSSVDEAFAGQKAQAALSQAVLKTGENVATVLPVLQKWSEGQTQFGVSSAEALQGLARTTEITGSTRKGMEAYTAALEISKATGKDFTAVSLAVGKALTGQTTALSRYIGAIKKGTTDAELLDRIQEHFGGQALANTTSQEQFAASLKNTEEIIGNALLPSLDKYLKRGGDWLNQMVASGKLQKDVANDAREIGKAFSFAEGAIHDIDRVTGSFKHTLELLIGLKAASKLFDIATNMGLIGDNAEVAAGKVGLLKGSLGGLGKLGTVVIPITVAVAIENTSQYKKAHSTAHDALGKLGFLVDPIQTQIKDEYKRGKYLVRAAAYYYGALTGKDAGTYLIDGAAKTLPGSVESQLPRIIAAATKAQAELAGGLSKGLNLTVEQRNTFFDNSIAQILLLGGLKGIQGQIDALDKADALLDKRLAKTKDVTRKQKLSDELAQNEANIANLRAQQVQNAVDAAQKARDRAQAAAEAALTARETRQFRLLGLNSQGNDVIPGVPRLKAEAQSIEQQLKGSPLDTPALKARLKGIQKVLAEGIVPGVVRSKIQQTLAGITADLKKFQGGVDQLFKHQSSANFVKSFEKAAGIDLTGDQKRVLQGLVSIQGKGGSIPGKTSAAFSVHNDVNVAIDGHAVTKAVTTRQIRRSKKRTIPRGA